jgi:hypothetical protein
MELSNMLFVGFDNKVVALDRTTGTLLWKWKAPKGDNYPAVLLDGEQLFVSLMGYTYCLDPYTGHQIWENDLPGLGVGVACIATGQGSTTAARAAVEEESKRQQQAASHPH